jgi:hypothetical protein
MMDEPYGTTPAIEWQQPPAGTVGDSVVPPEAGYTRDRMESTGPRVTGGILSSEPILVAAQCDRMGEGPQEGDPGNRRAGRARGPEKINRR